MVRHATTADIVKINAKLVQVLRKTGEDRCEYVDRNITDDTVAKQLNVMSASVARVRKELFGNLQAPHGGRMASARLDDIEARCVTLEQEIAIAKQQLVDAARSDQIKTARLDMLVTVIEEIMKAQNTLCSTLALNRVADVRNLAIDLPSMLAKLKPNAQPYRR